MTSAPMPDPTAPRTAAHLRIRANLQSLLCQAIGDDALFDPRVRVDATRFDTRPDLVACSGPRHYSADDPDVLLNPALVVEVQWTGALSADRSVHLRHYRRVPSFREYLLIEQDAAGIDHYVRQADGQWHVGSGLFPDDEFELVTLPVRFRLADVYNGVPFPDTRFE